MKVISDDIKKGEFKSVYLLYGEEEYLKKQYKIQPTNVYMWANKKANISAGRCIQIELLTDPLAPIDGV